jgi:hypothetical protein
MDVLNITYSIVLLYALAKILLLSRPCATTHCIGATHARGGHPQSFGLSRPRPPGPHAFVVVVIVVVVVGRGTLFAQPSLQLS